MERTAPAEWTLKESFAIQDSLVKGIKVSSAGTDGYNQVAATGKFVFDSSYLGCPHCGATAFSQCGGCNRVSCWDGESRTGKCPWCGKNTKVEGQIESIDGVVPSGFTKQLYSKKAKETTTQLQDTKHYLPTVHKEF